MQITPESIQEGQFLLVNKPLRWTSHDVIARLRGPLKSYTGNRKLKVGHAGTLDPLASGLLIVLTGKATKRAEETQLLDKTYSGTITLGGITESYDLETPVTAHAPFAHLQSEQIREAAQHFTGSLEQYPPKHSSVKIEGKPAYFYAREGEEKAMRPRTVSIYAFEVTNIALPDVHFRVTCSKGTYIRSLAHDFGQYLGCGGYLSALCREQIGSFHLRDAMELPDLLVLIKKDKHSTDPDAAHPDR